MTQSVKDARAELVSAVRLYAPVHSAFAPEATNALNAAMDNLQAATLAEAQAPAVPPPVPAAAVRGKKKDEPADPSPTK